MALVCSAACGADLIALDVAGAMGLKRRVVLSSPPERFRASSVVDRPGDFGPAFDRVIADLERTPDLVVLGKTEAGENPYETANRVILDQAMTLASAPGYVLAVIVWEGRSRGKGDLTRQFADEARARGIEVVEIVTLQSVARAGRANALQIEFRPGIRMRVCRHRDQPLLETQARSSISA